MEQARARAIAATIVADEELSVESIEGVLRVNHCGNIFYFAREACFWPYMQRISGMLRQPRDLMVQAF